MNIATDPLHHVLVSFSLVVPVVPMNLLVADSTLRIRQLVSIPTRSHRAKPPTQSPARDLQSVPLRLKLSVGVTCHPYLLETEGLFTQGWRPGRTVGESVGGIFEMDSSDWSNGIRYHTFDTRPDTEFNEGSSH